MKKRATRTLTILTGIGFLVASAWFAILELRKGDELSTKENSIGIPILGASTDYEGRNDDFN